MVKTWGKSPRRLQVIAIAGKPCMLKCHVYPGLPKGRVSGPLTTHGKGRQNRSLQQCTGQDK